MDQQKQEQEGIPHGLPCFRQLVINTLAFDVEPVGDLFGREALVVVHLEDLPLPGRHTLQKRLLQKLHFLLHYDVMRGKMVDLLPPYGIRILFSNLIGSVALIGGTTRHQKKERPDIPAGVYSLAVIPKDRENFLRNIVGFLFVAGQVEYEFIDGFSPVQVDLPVAFVITFTKPPQHFRRDDAVAGRNASYLKCSNITLGYSFPALFKIAGHESCSGRAFVTTQNPFIISKYKGIDPEVASGVDSNPYPRPFSVQIGLSLNF